MSVSHSMTCTIIFTQNIYLTLSKNTTKEPQKNHGRGYISSFDADTDFLANQEKEEKKEARGQKDQLISDYAFSPYINKALADFKGF